MSSFKPHTRNKMLIVDGYNVLRSGARYSHMLNTPDYTVEVLNAVRESLINDVIGFAGHEYKAVIVFDGANNPYANGKEQTVGGVRVIFSPEGSSADKVIEKLAHDARERQVEVMVVTSDAAIQDAVFGFGVDRMSADGFSREANRMEDEASSDSNPAVSRKNTVADRINPDTLEKLRRMRDGE